MIDTADEPKILLVDDDATVRFLVREGLESCGFEVIEAADGWQALTAFTDHQPDVVLLDILMPHLDGFAACAEMRRMPGGADLPIVVMTGLDDTASINQAFDAGATTFITKPINTLVLNYRLRYILRSKRTADQLRISERRLQHAQRIAKLGHWEWQFGEPLVYCSEGLLAIAGLGGEGSQVSWRRLLRMIDRRDGRALREALRRVLRDQHGYRLEHGIVLADGQTRFIYHETDLLVDERGAVKGIVGITQDVTDRRDAEARIRRLAYFDAVTGLPNRSLLMELIGTALDSAQRHNRLVALLLIDLDNFKLVNDTLGHDAGDALLAAVATRMRECLRSSDRVSRAKAIEPAAYPEGDAVSRLGGDEFVVLLTEIKSEEYSARVARRLAQALAGPFDINGQEVLITASIGISLFPIDGDRPETLLKNADAAMYHAKKAGRNGYQFYTDNLNDEAFRRFMLETNLRRAIARGEFCLHFQPKIDVSCEEVIGFEALLRWDNEDLGRVSPAEFIPVAEEMGLIITIGEWVMEEVCAQAAAWQLTELKGIPISFNLSAAQLKQKHLVEIIQRTCSRSQVSPELFEVELTESALIENADASLDIMKKLSAIGLRLTIDDFGTGYSSLSYLKRLPLNALKIDRSFVRDITSDTDDAIIVEAIIALAHNLRLSVVAEGVEQADQLAFLRARGCDVVQGYFYSPPLPVAEIGPWLAGRRLLTGTMTDSPPPDLACLVPPARLAIRPARLPVWPIR